MTAAETLHAAAQALIAADTSSLHRPLADWLTATADGLELRAGVWERAGQDVDGLTAVMYRRPLAVARAVLAEVTV